MFKQVYVLLTLMKIVLSMVMLITITIGIIIMLLDVEEFARFAIKVTILMLIANVNLWDLTVYKLIRMEVVKSVNLVIMFKRENA